MHVPSVSIETLPVLDIRILFDFLRAELHRLILVKLVLKSLTVPLGRNVIVNLVFFSTILFFSSGNQLKFNPESVLSELIFTFASWRKVSAWLLAVFKRSISSLASAFKF